MNNKNIEILKPLIFNKKKSLNLNHKNIPLDVVTRSRGLARTFPAATKEWYNSVYTYNQNSVKNLSIADKTLSKLVKSYFNLYYINKSSIAARRLRRDSLNKILISKAELKHTNSKVTVTLYAYNAEKIFWTLRLKELMETLFTTYRHKNFNESLAHLLKGVDDFKKKVSLLNYLENLKDTLKLNLDLKVDPVINSHIKVINEMINISKKDKIANKKLNRIYTESLIKISLDNIIKKIALSKLFIRLNESKFEDGYIIKLKQIIGRIYNKEVEFNIINLKTLSFNSDLFTEVIATKLKDRKNKLLKLLKIALYSVKLPISNRMKQRNIDKSYLDNLNNLRVSSVINKFNTDKDALDQLLLDVLPSSIFMLYDRNKMSSTAYNKNYVNTYNPLDIVLNSLKNKDIGGVRFEVKGRLSKRSAASRSVFKVKWKGSLKNLDSTHRKLTSVVLRGHMKSNLQYSLINTKTRNGAFGLKGWISSK